VEKKFAAHTNGRLICSAEPIINGLLGNWAGIVYSQMLSTLWVELPALPKLFWLILVGVSTYTLFSATLILIRLHSLANQQAEAVSIGHSLAVLEARSANVRQLITTTLYLFGLTLFVVLPNAFKISELSRTPELYLIGRNLGTYFAFAALTFLAFLVLHCVQWFVSSRIQSHLLRLRKG
jgi:hypothetical protein